MSYITLKITGQLFGEMTLNLVNTDCYAVALFILDWPGPSGHEVRVWVIVFGLSIVSPMSWDPCRAHSSPSKPQFMWQKSPQACPAPPLDLPQHNGDQNVNFNWRFWRVRGQQGTIWRQSFWITHGSNPTHVLKPDTTAVLEHPLLCKLSPRW